MDQPINPFAPEALQAAALGPFARPHLDRAFQLGAGTALDPGEQQLGPALGLPEDRVRALQQMDPRVPEFLGAPEAQRLQAYLSQGDSSGDGVRQLLHEVLEQYQRQPRASGPQNAQPRAARAVQAAPGYGEGPDTPLAPVPDTGPWWLG